MVKIRFIVIVALAFVSGTFVAGQVSRPVISGAAAESVPLGVEDQIALQTPEIPELDKREFTVQADGTVEIPIVGGIKAAGLTIRELNDSIIEQLKKLYRNPQISISVIKLKSRTVSVLGAVNNPGIQSLEGKRTILDVLAAAGGLRQDAGPVIELTRPSPGGGITSDDPDRRAFEIRRISVSSLLEADKPTSNISVSPGDVITVPKGKMVYVVGDVKRPGGFIIGESDNLTVLKALSLSEGLESSASAAHARILRSDGPGRKSEESVDLRKLLAGKTEDIRLRADDILFVPSSAGKKIAIRAIEAAIQTGSGVAIFRP